MVLKGQLCLKTKTQLRPTANKAQSTLRPWARQKLEQNQITKFEFCFGPCPCLHFSNLHFCAPPFLHPCFFPRDLHPSVMCRNMLLFPSDDSTTHHHHAKVKETEAAHQGQCSMPALQANFQEGKLVGGWSCPQPRFVFPCQPRIKDHMP